MNHGEITALVVDDEADNRYLVQLVLESCGIRVLTAASVRAALEIVARQQIELVVSDITMPEQDGCDLIRAVRALADPRKARIPAIALTGLSNETDRVRILGAGFDVHLIKPFDVDELTATVATLRKSTAASACAVEQFPD